MLCHLSLYTYTVHFLMFLNFAEDIGSATSLISWCLNCLLFFWILLQHIHFSQLRLAHCLLISNSLMMIEITKWGTFWWLLSDVISLLFTHMNCLLADKILDAFILEVHWVLNCIKCWILHQPFEVSLCFLHYWHALWVPLYGQNVDPALRPSHCC